MLPIRVIREQLGELLAADTGSLAPVTANEIALVKEAFTPSENLEIADVTLADFTGSTPIAGVAGTQLVGNDPATGEQVITIKSPAGGWRWESTATLNLPQTIYGFVLTDSGGSNLLASQLLPTPITINESGQEIDLGAVTMRIVAQPIS